ncbi:hypothetical protein [Paraburkholderia caballeronis]|uniref:hypothetical protein n=1 Tax=Paraburkholderia caballeronis TaxID=416943 RepID=UPI001416F51B|nr:hypothetical protein [Paraburkholderia caballeronis]
MTGVVERRDHAVERANSASLAGDGADAGSEAGAFDSGAGAPVVRLCDASSTGALSADAARGQQAAQNTNRKKTHDASGTHHDRNDYSNRSDPRGDRLRVALAGRMPASSHYEWASSACAPV